jgi:phosphoribosylformylglycinamidine synthase
VCESARNVACVGARPLAITNCLNFGSPERPEVMGDFAAAIRGMRDACLAFGVPVTGGNVSFYNESPHGAVHPTTVVGMLGVLDDAYAHRRQAAREGDVIVLFGETRPELGGTEALALIEGIVAGRPPALDIAREVALVRLLATGHGAFAHDLSEGGLAVALAEMCVSCGIGAVVALPGDIDPLWGLFGESTARAIVTCRPDEAEAVLRTDVPAAVIGRVTGNRLRVQGALDVTVDDLAQAYRDAIPSLMER